MPTVCWKGKVPSTGERPMMKWVSASSATTWRMASRTLGWMANGAAGSGRSSMVISESSTKVAMLPTSGLYWISRPVSSSHE